jgi:licheninase
MNAPSSRLSALRERTFRLLLSGSGLWLLLAGGLLAAACGGNSTSTLPGVSITGGSSSGGLGSGGVVPASGGASPSGGQGGTAATDPRGYLIDDFEDHDKKPVQGTGWYSYDDKDSGGLSSATISFPEEGFESSGSLLLEYTLDQGTLTYDPQAGVAVNVTISGTVPQFSEYSGISYVYKGDAHLVRLHTSDVADYDYHGFRVAAASDWTLIEIPFVLFNQAGWGEAVALDSDHIREVSFHVQAADGRMGALAIDDLYASDVDADFPLVAKEPEVPELEVLETLTIDNPLQQLALDHLSKGMNLSDWLEAGRFSGFENDANFVQNLADAGFASLRLPIDLDLYVESVSGSGDDVELELHEDLWTILDSFEDWTAQSGLSLTIDFHQYDNSLNFGEPDTMDLAVALWGAVAEHFASNSRVDVFYELLNEPELSVSGTFPTAEQWTALAERMIAAIRAHDTTHTILFGDVEWYGIGPLSMREPLSDDNVIYVFHFYEPFLFSHQGTGWTPLLSVHDVPYPYETSRWPENGLDIGITELTNPWVLTLVDEYHTIGSKNWMYNRIAEAKKWGIDHNVPVICNEFGVFEGASGRADRAQYYTDLIDIFDQQEIPWTVWYRIMDEEGVVSPDYRTAFGLDP